MDLCHQIRIKYTYNNYNILHFNKKFNKNIQYCNKCNNYLIFNLKIMIKFKKIQKLKNFINELVIKLDFLPPMLNNILNPQIQTSVKL